jgi:hypothetical protein
MDPVYVYNIAKAATGAMLHFAKANTSELNSQIFENNYQVSFYPSPVKDFLNINLGSLTAFNYSFSIIYLLGKVVLNKQFENPHQIEKVSTEGLVKGMYLAVLQTKNKRITKKIIVE